MDNFIASYIGRHWLSYMYLINGKFSLSKDQIRIGIEESKQYDFVYGLFGYALMSAYVNMQSGRLQEALEAVNNTVETALVINIPEYNFISLSFRGIVYAKMHKFSQAYEEAEKLKQLVESTGIKKSIRYYFLLTGHIFMEEGQITKAIQEFERAVSFLPQQPLQQPQ